jgi:hypothetical protein
VTPFFPICMRGLRVWAWCLRRLRVFLSSMVSSVWRGGIYGLRRGVGLGVWRRGYKRGLL